MALRQRSFHPENRGPLAGVRVLDLSRLVCGNTLTLLLADYGAEVIKVEPLQGDTLRAWQTAGVETHWKQLARNKHSLCLDLHRAEAIDLIKELVAETQVFVESFRPGTIEKMGLGPDVLFAINPRLIVVRISGWGQTGPYRERPGFGSLVEGMSGLAAMSGFPDREPLLPPNALADSIAGYAGAMAALIALRHVETNGGPGQLIDLPLFDPLFSILGPLAAQYRLTGKVRPRVGSRSTNAAPRNVYRTKDDKWVALSASTQAMAERLFIAIGHPEINQDSRYRTNSGRVANVDALDAIIGDFVATLDQKDACDFFEKAEVTVGPIYDISQIVEDTHFQEREIIVEVPDDDVGRFPMAGIVPRMLGTPGDLFRPAPKLGQDSVEILRRAGVRPEVIERLCEAGVVVDSARAPAAVK
jgi:formyl-CoA transferase